MVGNIVIDQDEKEIIIGRAGQFAKERSVEYRACAVYYGATDITPVARGGTVCF